MPANDDALEDLLKRAERSVGAGGAVHTAFAGVRAIIGVARFPAGETLAEEAMETLRKGQVPTPAQIAALETVIKALRPSILSQQGLLDGLPAYQKHEPGTVSQWNTFRNTAKPLLYSVGRIDLAQGDTPAATTPLATGFVVAPGAVVTNTHVLDALSAGVRQLQKGQAVMLFGQEFGVVPDRAPVAITGVIAVHPKLDMCLLRIADQTLPAWPIDGQPTQKTRRVAAIGYPQDDPRSPVFRDVIFNDRYLVKRGAPGEVRGVTPNAVYHDCSTLGGNSGSPLVDLDSCKIVGVHRDGPLFLFRNEAVDGGSLAAFVQQNTP